MMFLILASVLCFASADLLKRAAPAVDESLNAFYHGSSKAGSLSEALGVNEKWLDEAGDDIQAELAKLLKETLEKFLQKVKDDVDYSKEFGKELLEKVKELKKKLKDLGVEVGDDARELVDRIKGKAKEIIRKLLKDLGLGKRNLDDQMDAIARSKFSEFIKEVLEKITSDETIQKIRDYIKKIGSESELAKALKKLVEKLHDADLKELIRSLLEHRPKNSQSALAHNETWKKIKDFFKDLKVKIGDHVKKFGEWVKESWGTGMDKLKEKYGTVKAIAMEFIAHAKDVSAEVAREALEFFRPYKEDLGTLWDQLIKVAKERIGQF